MTSEARTRAAALIAATAFGFALRLYASHEVGFGDSEALYASYALHPQPAYLDHPGLIGVVARALGRGSSPTPFAAHAVTSVVASLAPWITVLAARAARASWASALAAGLAVAVTPEIAVGLFAMTPDLLLFPAWTAALGLACAALLAPPSTVRAAVCFLLAGLACGIGLAAKVSAGPLMVALALSYASRAARAHARTAWPWLGLALGAIVVAPIGLYEAHLGWPMLHHRLVATQGAAGVSLRNLGALLGGQLVYVSPVLAVVATLVAWDLWKSRDRDAVARLLSNALLVPLAVLVPLCVWSRVAEPHWIAPALLALPIHYARPASATADAKWRRFAGPALAVGAVFSLAVYAWVLVPQLVALVPASAYDARLDLSNELHGWPEVVDALRTVAERHRREAPDAGDLVVVGPHWVVCAQLEASLRGELPVGCAADGADFAYWNPRRRWERASILLYVTDSRFPVEGVTLFQDRARIDERTIEQRRDGRLLRTFRIEVLSLRGGA